jgi:DNA-binding NtrC family response regulator
MVKKKDWRELAQQAANEQNPQKLLALVEELTQVLEQQERRTRRPVSMGKRLLFVDDESSIRLTLPPVLEKSGFTVRTAATVGEAIAEIKKQTFDVLLSDLNIEGEADGFRVVRAMRESNPQCVTVILTAYPAFESALTAIHEEVDEYVVKPAEITSLVSLIERRLRIRRS